ncbi:Putative mannose-6-phosphate isomerase [Elusimicrobium minutum Pei191]|uniref:Putative mannose-6-phosphate isomerase n=1 Tax=Elusimicrobium minutum (strain Pei191) TaxID=445932 RepID=B2KDF4_ELUMP|nr:cupin domain-containing protein [Elusimicrobium minutum]ACC98550.1 Putative mannose-6-phosphate isomerase [Elusimicrobium minutum Pei191]
MSKKMEITKEEANFTALNIGKFDDLSKYTETKGKVFLKEMIKATSVEISFQLLPAGTRLPFAHIHKQNEEVYIVIKGKGIFEVDGVSFPIEEGSLVRVAPKGKRILESAPDSEMVYMVVQAKENSLRQWTQNDGVIA